MALINVDDIYILGETGAQVDKVTGLFTKDEDTTSGEKAFAQLNIGTAGSNRNLLDNPWWGSGEVANQRGNTSGQTTVSYSIDRWKMTAGSAYGNWSLGANGITITAASGTYAVFQQLLEPRLYRYLAGKTVTCSALLSDGTVVSGTVQSVDWSSNTTVVVSGNLRLWLVSGGIFRVLVQDGGSFTIRAVKLELGSVSTLANDVPPDYGEELAKCQRYFARISVANASVKTPIAFGFENAPTQCRFKLTTPVPLRATPTPSASGTFYLDGSSGEHQVTSFASAAAVYLTTDGIIWAANSSGLTAGAYILNSINGGYIDLSADL